MYATNTLQSIFQQNLQFDFTYKLYYSDEFPDIDIDYIYDIKKVFEDAGFVFNEHIEHWLSVPDQVRGIYIEWKKDDYYKKLGK